MPSINFTPNKADTSSSVSSNLKYTTGVRPVNIVTAPVSHNVMTPVRHAAMSPVSHPSMANTQLLPGHESFIICPGQQPVKVTHAQTVSYYWPDWLIRIRYNKKLLYQPLTAN